MTPSALLDNAIARLAVLEVAIEKLRPEDTTLSDGMRLALSDVCEDIAAARAGLDGKAQ